MTFVQIQINGSLFVLLSTLESWRNKFGNNKSMWYAEQWLNKEMHDSVTQL